MGLANGRWWCVWDTGYRSLGRGNRTAGPTEHRRSPSYTRPQTKTSRPSDVHPRCPYNTVFALLALCATPNRGARCRKESPDVGPLEVHGDSPCPSPRFSSCCFEVTHPQTSLPRRRKTRFWHIF